MSLARPILVLSVLLGASAAAGAAGAALSSPPAWFTVVFELIVLMAAGFGVAASRRGARGSGAALALLCVAGAVLAGSVLGYVGAGQARTILGMPMKPWLLARVGVAGLFGLAAAWAALGDRRREALPRLLLGLGLGMPVVAVAWTGYTGQLGGWVAPLSQGVRAVLAVAGFVVLTGLLAASVQMTISAFAPARGAGPEGDDAAGGPKA